MFDFAIEEAFVIKTIFSRYMSKRCKTCNDLRADGHENGVGRARGLIDYDLDRNERASAVRREAAAARPLLQLESVRVQDLLKCRVKDKNGRLLNPCRYCRFICDALDEIFPDHRASWETRLEKGSLRGTVEFIICPDRPLVLRCRGAEFEVDVGWEWHCVDVEVYRDDDDDYSYKNDNADSDVTSTTKHVTVLPHCGPAGPIPPSSDSVESQAFVTKHYQHCLMAHPSCRPSGPKPVRAVPEGCAFVPTRLLRVTDDRVRIVDCWNQGETVSWAALSHCWGGSSIITLRRDSLDEMKEEIKWADLPMTFQNAISVARRLDLDHVWIDSLCIIQDDSEDWKREAADMGAVYGYAAIVLGAAMSGSPYEPFLREREDKWKATSVLFHPIEGPPVPFRARRRTIPATRLEQGLYEPPFTSDWATLRRPGPLYRRSWSFQEAFLAVRAVHFNPGGLVFECKTHRVLEGGLPPYASTTENTLGEVSTPMKWRMICKAYSARLLSFPKDRLPALAGIAALLQADTGDRYVAGLWASTLLADLLWHAMPGAEDFATAFPLVPYIGPSWSWVSIGRGVVWTTYKDFEPLASVLGFHISLAGANPYGAVNSAALAIRGRLLRCRIRWDAKGYGYVVYFLEDNGAKSSERWFPCDGHLVATHAQESSGQGDVGTGHSSVGRVRIGVRNVPRELHTDAAFLCIGKTPRLGHDHIGLILGRCMWSGEIKGVQPMERIGSISNLPQEWYDAGEEQVVVLL